MKYRMSLYLVIGFMILAVGPAFPAGTQAQEHPDRPAETPEQDENPTSADEPAPAEQPAREIEKAPVSKSTAVKPAPAVQPALPDEWVKTLDWRCIGPANMGGRIVDIAVYEKDPAIWWAATASGGLVKTTNNGITFEHQFDREQTVSIGDAAVAPSDPEIVWVGTGEANPRNSVSWGDGVYKSTDGGKTWKNMGLKASFQIGRIAIHPENPDIVYVGALGRLWGPNEERGLFKTVDGGAAWEKILYVDDKTGVIDVQMKPGEPDTLLVATYERERDGFDSNDPSKKWGPGSGIYRTVDGGRTFEKITEGLPTCSLGRIGLDFYRADPNIVFAVVESERVGQEPENAPYLGVQGEDVEVGARLTEIVEDGPADKAGLKAGDIVVAIEDTTIHSYSELNSTIRRYLADDTVKFEISRDRKSEFVEVTFSKRPGAEEDEESEGGERRRPRRRSAFSSGLGGQRENLQEQQGNEGHQYGGIYKSTDGGASWTRINSVNPRPMYYSQIRVDPSDANYIYVLGTSLYRSSDGGVTFTDDGGRGVHVDHHGMWIDPDDGRHMILGNDGGIYVTCDRMENWDHLNHVAIGQFYHVAVGPQLNYKVYGGLQDNGSWGGPSRSRSGSGPVNEDWFSIGGGDGFVCRVDPDDPDQIYSESQGGSMGRYNLRTGERGYARPRAPRGTRYRFNWKTPYILSNHNSRIFLCAGNYVFRSLDRGENLKAISPEITCTDKGSGTALAESRFDPDVLYVGTDDGALWRTLNGGHDWQNLFEIEKEEHRAEDAAEGPVASASGAGDRSAGGRSRRGERGGSGRGGPGGGGRGGQMLSRLKSMDSDGDGKIASSEMPERLAFLFERLDANEDGFIDMDEIDAMARGQGEQPPPAGAEGESAPPDAADKESGPEPREEARQAGGESGGDEPPGGEEKETVSGAEGAEEAHTAPADSEAQEEEPSPPEAAEDPVTGEWRGQAVGDEIPAERGGFTVILKLGPDGRKVTGSFSSDMSEGEIVEGHYNPDSRKLTLQIETDQMPLSVTADLAGSTFTGRLEVGAGMFTLDFEARRVKPGSAGESGAADTGKPARDDGHDWKRIDALVPGPRWVNCLETSRFEKGRVYLVLDGHRSNDDSPYVFVSEDHGTTWRSLAASLPAHAGTTRVIREDIENPDILYLGTEFSAWISIDRGKTWTSLNTDLPTVAVHEFAQHPETGEVVVATHGRSLWVLDVSPLRQINAEVMASKVHLFKPKTVYYWRSEPRRGGTNRRFVGANPSSGTRLHYYLGKKVNRCTLKVTDLKGDLIREFETKAEPGLHHVSWDLRKPAPEDRRSRYRRSARIDPGTYLVVLSADNLTVTQPLTIEGDPEYPDSRTWEESRSEQPEESGPHEGG